MVDVLITERGWKVKKEISLGLGTARWFTRALEDCLKARRKEFYSAHREGGWGYIAQRCSNSRGCYMALVEYGGGGHRSFIFIPEDTDGRGWRKLAEVLREVGRGPDLPSPPLTTLALQQPLARSYREALQQPRESVRVGANSDTWPA